MTRSLLPVVLLAVVVALVGTACGADPAIFEAAPMSRNDGGSDTGPTATTTAEPTTTTTTTTLPPVAGVATVPTGGAVFYDAPEGEQIVRIHEHIELGFSDRSDGWLLVTGPCNDPAWVREAEVEVTAQAEASRTDLIDPSEAVVVLDPGHGGRDWGAVGAEGLPEKDLNIEIAEIAEDLMGEPRDVNWATGAVVAGETYPAFERVFLTRRIEGPDGGDFEVGLAYRAELANSAGAHALVSIHNNSVPQREVDRPGTEVYYSVGAEGSDRLASLLYEELDRSFSQFDVDWRGGFVQGARARVDGETGDDYYGLLRRAEMPAVIAEGVYITNPPEEELALTEEFREAYAAAVYRALIRFFTTADTGPGVNDPEVFGDDAGTASTSRCVIPEQP